MMKRHLPKSKQHDYKMVKQYFFSTVKLDYKAMLGEPFFFCYLITFHMQQVCEIISIMTNKKLTFSIITKPFFGPLD